MKDNTKPAGPASHKQPIILPDRVLKDFGHNTALIEKILQILGETRSEQEKN